MDWNMNGWKKDSDKGIMIRRMLALAVISAMLLTISAGLCGCGRGGDEGADGPAGKAAGSVISGTDDELTLVDQAGREVTVKRDPGSIALCYRVVIRFLLNLGQGGKITGIGKSEPFLEMVQPSLAGCADVGKGVADIEALAALKPDLFIHKASDTETLEAVQKIGIPAVGIEVETPDEMLTALDILGKICGAEDRAAELAGYYEEAVGRSKELADTLTDDERRTAVVMGSSIGKVADGSMLQGEMLEAAGAINCAADLKATELWPTVGTEQIFAWDPDYIFITGSGAGYTPDDLYSDPAWSGMKAVRDKHIYVIPSRLDSWEFPGVVSSLGIEFMQSMMYPGLVSPEQLGEDADDFYEMAYGRSFSRDEIGY